MVTGSPGLMRAASQLIERLARRTQPWETDLRDDLGVGRGRVADRRGSQQRHGLLVGGDVWRAR